MSTPTRISIIDDDHPLLEALIALLRSVGHQASGHGSAEAFLQSGEAAFIDCLITDIELPEMSGLDLIFRLREAARAPAVIIITARTEASLLDRASQSAALCILRKPFAADDLLACLETALAAG